MPLRIAMVIDAWLQPYNGTVVSTRRFVEALAAAGETVRVLAIDGEAGPPPEPRIEIAPFTKLSVPGFNRLIDTMRAPLARPDRARLSAALEGCDLLHMQFPFLLGFVAVGAARRKGLPVVCSFHVQPENILINIGLNNRLFSNLLYRLFIAGFYNRADLVIAPTPFAADLLRRHGAIRPIEVVSNGAPQAFFQIARAPRDPASMRIKLLSVGRLAAEKRPETLLRAVARCAHRDSIDLVLAGAGPREAELKAHAARLGLNAQIGPVSNEALMALYAGADLFVHCGSVELEGMSVLEAMASGNAVLVSDAPDSASAHVPLDARARFRSGDAADLAARIDDWLGDPDRITAQGEANRRYAAEFAHDRSVAKLREIYARVAKGRPNRG